MAANDDSVVRRIQINEGSQALFMQMMPVAIFLALWGFEVRPSDDPSSASPEVDATAPAQVGLPAPSEPGERGDDRAR